MFIRCRAPMAAFLLAILCGITPVRAQGQSENHETIEGGLRSSLSFVGRSSDGRSVTVSLIVTNIQREPIFISLFPPGALMVDNAGQSYELAFFGGTGKCYRLSADAAHRCAGNDNNYLPNSAFTLLPPNKPTTLTFSFTGAAGYGDRAAFASTFAMRTQNSMYLLTGDRGIKLINISMSDIKLGAGAK